MKRSVIDQIEEYKRACPPWVIDLWDAADEKYLEQKFRRMESDDDRD